MARLAAFLRGINVGGHVVTKDVLQGAFRDAGFEDGTTFRQSGNVIFDARGVGPGEATAKIATALRKRLGYDVAVFVRSFADLRKALDSAPRSPSEGTSILVTLLPSPPPRFPFRLPAKIPKSTAEVISASRGEAFSETHGGGEGALPNPFLESELGVKATTRNLNVIRDIVERSSEEA